MAAGLRKARKFVQKQQSKKIDLAPIAENSYSLKLYLYNHEKFAHSDSQLICHLSVVPKMKIKGACI